ncbi:MAG: DUF1080 domain-containing protein [Phycisphaerales bacterium]|nr:DUF1080 domain-containing protein [Phycisphaerales bacterium]
MPTLLNTWIVVCLILWQSPAAPPPPPRAASPAVTTEVGFVSLFDGKTLDGWVGDIKGYAVDGGAITCLPSGSNLFTAKEYADFHLKFEVQLTAGANNGIAIRAPDAGDAAFAGIEIQVLDNTDPKHSNLKPWQYHGSIYGVVPAKREFLKPVGEWNAEEIIVRGSHIQVVLNDHMILDADIAKAATEGTMDGKLHPGLRRQSGHIGFLGHGDKVSFRNIRIKEMLR